jgi:hypothetical protein
MMFGKHMLGPYFYKTVVLLYVCQIPHLRMMCILKTKIKQYIHSCPFFETKLGEIPYHTGA